MKILRKKSILNFNLNYLSYKILLLILFKSYIRIKMIFNDLYLEDLLMYFIVWKYHVFCDLLIIRGDIGHETY